MRALIFLLLVTSACAEVISDGPLTGFDLSKVSDDHARALREANADFQSVISGLAPRNAKLVTYRTHDAGDPRRDHHLIFRGHRYTMTVVKMPIRIGEVDGVVYGPDITFDRDLSKGYMAVFTQQRFYTRSDLTKLLRGEGRWVVIPVQGKEVEITNQLPP
jgi:hypothetical protein